MYKRNTRKMIYKLYFISSIKYSCKECNSGLLLNHIL